MRHFCILLIVLTTSTCLSGHSALAQEDPLAEAKLFPTYSNAARAKRALDSIDWQLGIKRELIERNAKQKERLLQHLSVDRGRLRALTEELPDEVRYVSAEVRSQLIGKAMSELLNAKLDLATRESVREQLKVTLEMEKEGNHAKLRKQQGKMEIDGAMLKVQLAESQFEQSRKLAKKGYTTENETRIAEYDLALARQELESVILKVDVEGEHENAELAQRLTAARVDIEPIKARITAVEQFLKAFRDSAPLTMKIEEIQRKTDGLSRNIRDLDLAVFQLRQEVEELQVLKSRIQNDLKPKKSAATDDK